MLPDRYLESGADALARSFATPAWTWDQFMDGHRGACMLAGYFLLADGLVEEAAAAPIQGLLDQEWGARPLFAPLPAEPAEPGGLERLLAGLRLSMADGGHVGHNVIYPTFALRAFQRRPELITRTRVDGLLVMAKAYTREQPATYPEAPPFAAAGFSAWVLESYLACLELHRGHGQGVTGHLLTYGQAVQDLHVLGHVALARIAERGFRDYVATALKGPSGDGASRPRKDPEPTPVRPERASYWTRHPAGILESTFGHYYKYAYALLHHARTAGDAALGARALAPYYLVCQ
jgi:hypothetical protein